MKKGTLLFILSLSILSSCMKMANLTIDGELASDTAIQDTIDLEADYTAKYDKNLMKNFFSCDEDSLDVGYISRMIEVKIDNPIGQCFGIWFDPIHLSDSAHISFEAKYTGTDSLEIMTGFTDDHKGEVYDPTKSAILKGDVKGFQSFDFNFTDVIVNHESNLDTSSVQTVIIYLNPKEKKGLEGLLTVKNIEVR